MRGNLINRLMEGAKQPTPEVGMGATYCGWSDRHPYTVVEVKSPTTIVVQRDTATRVDSNGMSEVQTYEYSRNPDAERVTVTLRRNGRWVAKGEPQTAGAFSLGRREKYYDYSF